MRFRRAGFIPRFWIFLVLVLSIAACTAPPGSSVTPSNGSSAAPASQAAPTSSTAPSSGGGY
jgi:hypothetical protein